MGSPDTQGRVTAPTPFPKAAVLCLQTHSLREIQRPSPVGVGYGSVVTM